MYWKITRAESVAPELVPAPDGRFVLHRHHDAEGPHLDLRIEHDGSLLGWRIAGLDLAAQPWATEKSPHPAAWLAQNGDAIRMDSGNYAWLCRDATRKALLLCGTNGIRQLCFDAEPGLPLAAVRALTEALSALDVAPEQAPRLLEDGLTARRQAIERLCGLGRELDGAAFDDALWRNILRETPLADIHAHLRGYEVRFDAKYPPQPVSRPETLPNNERVTNAELALTILRD